MAKNIQFVTEWNDFEKIVQTKSYSKIFVLCDENTNKYCLPHLQKHFKQFHSITIKSGDNHKTLQACNKIWQILNQQNADRKSLLINLGGGMICDVGGFAASVYKRGIDCIHIPTTLMAMCDAAIGGKNAINFLNFKNNIGSFKLPTKILVDIIFLKTLPERELKSGLAEVIKHAMLNNDKTTLQLLKTKNLTELPFEKIIKNSIDFKTSIVAKDFTDNGFRKVLNAGHTIGHAIETLFLKSKKKMLLHGEAVAVGLKTELLLSVAQLDFPIEKANEMFLIIDKWFQPVHFNKTEKQKILQLINADKKNENGKINFTLFRNLGQPIIDCYIAKSQIEQALSSN